MPERVTAAVATPRVKEGSQGDSPEDISESWGSDVGTNHSLLRSTDTASVPLSILCLWLHRVEFRTFLQEARPNFGQVYVYEQGDLTKDLLFERLMSHI